MVQNSITANNTRATEPTIPLAREPLVQNNGSITNIVDEPVIGSVIQKQNLQVVHKPVVQEIHQQKIIELEKQNIFNSVQQDTIFEHATAQTQYEEVGNAGIESQLSQLNVAQQPFITHQSGQLNESSQGEVVAQIIHQDNIEHHVQPVITEVREQNIVQEVLHPVVRKVNEETIIREINNNNNNTLDDNVYYSFTPEVVQLEHSNDANHFNQPTSITTTNHQSINARKHKHHQHLKTAPVITGKVMTSSNLTGQPLTTNTMQPMIVNQPVTVFNPDVQPIDGVTFVYQQ
ncbi:leucine tRS [Acrasis kona]|uniref:Leucine tRS n=1 Tax=Acrasis kona TaxID=1008807 RepID=A0AAW2ZM00_9EUKA